MKNKKHFQEFIKEIRKSTDLVMKDNPESLLNVSEKNLKRNLWLKNHVQITLNYLYVNHKFFNLKPTDLHKYSDIEFIWFVKKYPEHKEVKA